MRKYTPAMITKIKEYIKAEQKKKRARKLYAASLSAGRKGVTNLRTAQDIEDRFAFNGVSKQRAYQNRQARHQRHMSRGW